MVVAFVIERVWYKGPRVLVYRVFVFGLGDDVPGRGWRRRRRWKREVPGPLLAGVVVLVILRKFMQGQGELWRS